MPDEHAGELNCLNRFLSLKRQLLFLTELADCTKRQVRLNIDHRTGQRGIDSTHQRTGHTLSRTDHHLTVDKRGHGNHLGHLAHRVNHIRIAVHKTLQAGNHDMRIKAQNTVTQVFLKSRHYRQDDIQRHHANHDSNHGNHGD